MRSFARSTPRRRLTGLARKGLARGSALIVALAMCCAVDCTDEGASSGSQVDASDGSDTGDVPTDHWEDAADVASPDAHNNEGSTDAANFGDVTVDAANCRLQFGSCDGCNCPPTLGHHVRLADNCFEEEATTILCRHLQGPDDCHVFPAANCLSRTLPDGAVEAFFVGSTPLMSGTTTDLTLCDGVLKTKVLQMSPCVADAAAD